MVLTLLKSGSLYVGNIGSSYKITKSPNTISSLSAVDGTLATFGVVGS